MIPGASAATPSPRIYAIILPPAYAGGRTCWPVVKASGGRMPKVGRNDPCPCGSGKKYKQCHLPIEEAAQAEQLRLRRAVDTLIPKIIETAQAHAADVPAAFERFWNGKYTLDQLSDLDDLEGRGAERFLIWFAFDYVLDDGRTLVERLVAAEPGDDLDLSAEERQLLGSWQNVHL